MKAVGEVVAAPTRGGTHKTMKEKWRWLPYLLCGSRENKRALEGLNVAVLQISLSLTAREGRGGQKALLQRAAEPDTWPRRFGTAARCVRMWPPLQGSAVVFIFGKTSFRLVFFPGNVR